MPFNEKGEFIRSELNPSRHSSARTNSANELRIPQAGRPRITSSEDRPGQRPARQRQRPNDAVSGREVLLGSLIILFATAVLVGMICLLVGFPRWIATGLAFWLLMYTRKLFR